MSTFLTIAMIYATYRVGKLAISSAIKRRKRKRQERAMQKAQRQPPMTPKEQIAQARAERLKELKANLEKSEAKVDAARLRSAARKDKLMGRPGWDETNLHSDRRYRHLLSRQAKAEFAFNADRKALQEHLMSTANRPEDSKQRFFSIRCNKLSDGTLTFELPHDAGASIINEMKLALSRDWGVAVGDLNRAQITEHKATDYNAISLGNPRAGMDKDIASSTVFVYDRTKGKVKPAGEQLTPETVNKIYQAKNDYVETIYHQVQDTNTILDRGDRKGFITLHTLGLDTVALAFNGVAIAYATAGPDGRIHIKGDDLPVGDKKSLKMASSVQEKLKDCTDFGQWLDKAIEILHSPENVQAGARAVERKVQLERSMRRMKEISKKVINSPKAVLHKGGPKR